MKRAIFCSVRLPLIVLGLVAGSMLAAEPNQQPVTQRGTIKAIDALQQRITIAAAGRDVELTAVEQTRLEDASGHPAKQGLAFEGYRPGATVMFRMRDQDGRSVLTAMKLVAGGNSPPGGNSGDRIRQPPPKTDLALLKPLTDMSPEERYKGFQGGLYPGGKNERPSAHTDAGLAFAKEVQPRDTDGRPAPDGKIVLLTIGMSNTQQASSGLLRMAAKESGLNPRMVIVNGALGGMTAGRIRTLNGSHNFNNGKLVKYWDYVDDRLKQAGVTRAQVQAIWLKQADPGTTLPFPDHVKLLQAEQVDIVHILHDRFPQAKLLYLSSRIFGGWAKTSLNPEPIAYESNFSVKWLIEQQLSGDPELNYDPGQGSVRSAWLSWGPYLWANGTTPRSSDGFHYVVEDLRDDDGTHESEQGQNKVGRELLKFFMTDPTSRDWFVASRATRP